MSISYTIRGLCDDHESLLAILEHAHDNSHTLTVNYYTRDDEPAPAFDYGDTAEYAAREPEHTAASPCIDPFCPTDHEQVCGDADMDLTPAQGIERPDFISERDRAMNSAVQRYLTALVIWTRQHITEGPISEISDAQLRGAYDDIMTYGLDSDIEDSRDLTLEQAQCIRGAFRDATAGQVPL